MKSTLRLFLVPLVTLIFAGVTFAQAPTTPTKPAPEKKSEMKAEKMEKAEKAKSTKVTGELTAVDAKAGTLTVKSKDKEIKLTAEGKAKSSLEKVKVGDTVRVAYTEKDGKMTASSISKSKGESKPKAMESKAPESKTKMK
jgi:Cu/Ag efflux protein CusF